MKRNICRLAVAALALWPLHAVADGDPPHILLDVSRAPDAGGDALKSSALVVEWYPKINDILYGPDHPLPFNVVVLDFEPHIGVPAATTGNVIHVSSDYIKVMPDDFRAMIVHELTHVVQHYTARSPGDGWVVEGMADYIRHKYFEKDIQETLRLDADGRLRGYGEKEPYNLSLERNGVGLDDRGYLNSYTVASTFLYWLELHGDKQIIRDLNLALAQGKYTPDLFQQLCGKPLDALWADFVAASKAAK